MQNLQASAVLLLSLQPPPRYLQRVWTESSGLQAGSYRAAASGPQQQHDGGLKEKVHGMALRLHPSRRQRPRAAWSSAAQCSRPGLAPLHVAAFRAVKHKSAAAARADDRRQADPVRPLLLGPHPKSGPAVHCSWFEIRVFVLAQLGKVLLFC